jgi:uncharacterized protein YjbI with pentapeptide repeats
MIPSLPGNSRRLQTRSAHTGRFHVQGKRTLVTGANLEGANLEDTKLEDANCQGASYNDRTIWPTG